ncbi:hypothetical protein MK559_08590 [Streptococcus gallolyticus subsp. gallolyticus]|nr:hypothetical protein [Streptococcus gallolyticus]MCY7172910.1 hypothetical protein [Streptococcus gallolyticus subsp. gallolyticus]MCY7179046.1 hypothetical protein [Streptococcus gallolyticus subsp. gallolyticus]MCY7181570.1 hypothetical protein [Streptococcus gallolyticus subsp. gallolyticus]
MTPIAKLSKNMMISELMRETGWSRNRALTAIEELEAANLIHFQPQGELKLRVNVEVL